MFKRSGDAKKALPMIETALLLDPVSPALRAVNATILVESGGIAQGVTEFEAALQLRADGPRKLNLAQLYLAQAGTLEENGQQAAADAQFSEANRIVDEVIETWPRYGHAHLVRATIYMGLGDPERARLELELAESLSPDTAMLWAVWAQYHLAQGEPSTAAAKMRRAVVLDPNNWQLRLQAARVFQAAGDDEAAVENVDAASGVGAAGEARRGQAARGPDDGASGVDQFARARARDAAGSCADARRPVEPASARPGGDPSARPRPVEAQGAAGASGRSMLLTVRIRFQSASRPSPLTEL